MNAFEALPEPAASRLRDSPLVALVQPYWDWMSEQHYQPHRIRLYLCGLSHFAIWSKQRQFDLGALDRHIDEFLNHHLSRCNCPAPVLRCRHHVSAVLGHLRTVAREVGVRQDQRHAGRFADDLQRFDEYMQHTKGLAASTRRRRVAIVGTLLSLPVNAATPSAGELRKFLAREFSRISNASAGVTVSAVRSYLRFRAFEGDRVDHLVPVVARPANWRLATLPKTLAPHEVDQLLNAFPPDLPSRLRCYAIVRSVVDLGLRSSEVVGLTLDDIDWQAGTVRINKSKSRRSDVLPLPHVTGSAIADYLRSERPQTTSRRVFVRHVSPVDKPVGTGVVRRAVRNAYRRAGLAHTSVHILRHTLARRMLDTGSTLKEVADVLRHRELDSSLIYAKVDFARLGAVVMPWPGSRP